MATAPSKPKKSAPLTSLLFTVSGDGGVSCRLSVSSRFTGSNVSSVVVISIFCMRITLQ